MWCPGLAWGTQNACQKLLSDLIELCILVADAETYTAGVECGEERLLLLLLLRLALGPPEQAWLGAGLQLLAHVHELQHLRPARQA